MANVLREVEQAESYNQPARQPAALRAERRDFFEQDENRQRRNPTRMSSERRDRDIAPYHSWEFVKFASELCVSVSLWLNAENRPVILRMNRGENI